MELKRTKVVMLPTDDMSNITVMYPNRAGSYLQFGTRKYYAPEHVKSQHLYFITDEEIKEGDWVFSNRTGSVGLCKHNWQGGYNGSYKIIASTDPKLIIEKTQRSMLNNLITNRVKLPQPSKAFIEKYCKVGGIDEVMVEYWIDNDHIRRKHLRDVPKGMNPETVVASILSEYLGSFPKVNSNKEITIHPIKTSWTLEELRLASKQLVTEGTPLEVAERFMQILHNMESTS